MNFQLHSEKKKQHTEKGEERDRERDREGQKVTAEQDIDKDAVYTEDGKGDTEVTEDEESDSDNEEVKTFAVATGCTVFPSTPSSNRIALLGRFELY